MSKKSRPEIQITILGLGPGDPGLLTRDAWQVIGEADDIYLRTRQHPTVAGFPPGLRVHSFDNLYENGASFEEVYRGIVDRVLHLSQRSQGVIYAVPGHPFVAEATTPSIVERAGQEGISCRIIPGVSFLEPTYSALGLDPLPATVLLDALRVTDLHHPPFPPDTPALIAQVHSPRVAGNVKLTLMSVYPDEHPVSLVHRAGNEDQKVEYLPLYEIDRSGEIGLMTVLYVPPLEEGTSFEAFQEVIAHLRAPDGCPWDREQDHQSLRPHLLEEAYEALTALDADDPQAMQEEFGDLLLQIVLHAQIAAEYGEFTMADVLRGIHTKLVARHPHVFDDVEIEETEEVLSNWERLKAKERDEESGEQTGVLSGVSPVLPALTQAQTYQKRAARVGFDWPGLSGVNDKVREELEEIDHVEHPRQRAAEVGDLLFAVVNLARWYDIDAESALREANGRFKHRFSYLEEKARSRDQDPSDLSLEELDQLWEEAKKRESGGDVS